MSAHMLSDKKLKALVNYMIQCDIDGEGLYHRHPDVVYIRREFMQKYLNTLHAANVRALIEKYGDESDGMFENKAPVITLREAGHKRITHKDAFYFAREYIYQCEGQIHWRSTQAYLIASAICDTAAYNHIDNQRRTHEPDQYAKGWPADPEGF